MRLVFCSHQDDPLGTEVLGYLGKKGCQTLLLEGDQAAPETAVALFSSPSEELKWIGRCSAVVAYRLVNAAPAWAATTPFLVAFREGDSLQQAGLHLARMYEHWLSQNKDAGCPWGSEPEAEENVLAFRQWQERAQGVLSPEVVWEKTPGLWPPKKKRPPRTRQEFWY